MRMVGDHELDGWLRLSLTPGVGDVTARRLLTAFGLPEQVFAQPEAALRQVVSAAQTRALLAQPPQWAHQCELTHGWLAAGNNRHVLTLADAAYPAELLEIADPPLLLYALGDASLLSHPKRLAVVGSRNPTAQGALTARDMCRSLAGAGVCIVSGLALGIDGAAHEGALDAGGSTIAVVGTGSGSRVPTPPPRPGTPHGDAGAADQRVSAGHLTHSGQLSEAEPDHCRLVAGHAGGGGRAGLGVSDHGAVRG
jgi:DNA processing protein